MSDVPPKEVDADAALLARIAKAEAPAVISLYNRIGSPLYSYALKTLGNPQDAEEAVQDTIVRIWKHAGSYDPSRAKAFTWCFMITKGICFDRLRRRNAAKRKSNIVPLQDTTAGELPDPTADVIHSLHLHEELGRVRAAMADLHPAERRYLELALFHGTTHAEIANGEDTPIGTVKSHIRRGMIKLRRTLSS